MSNECNDKTCPWQGGSSLSGKWRKLIQDPDRILRDYIKPGMWVLDAGCGMGYMAVGAASAVGENGKVVMADIQPEMLDGAMKRMKSTGFEGRVIPVSCRQNSLCIDEYGGKLDFAYAFMMVHEVDDRMQLLRDIYDSLKVGGGLLVAEPYLHVTRRNFTETLECARQIGFAFTKPQRKISFCRSIICKKKNPYQQEVSKPAVQLDRNGSASGPLRLSASIKAEKRGC